MLLLLLVLKTHRYLCVYSWYQAIFEARIAAVIDRLQQELPLPTPRFGNEMELHQPNYRYGFSYRNFLPIFILVVLILHLIRDYSSLSSLPHPSTAIDTEHASTTTTTRKPANTSVVGDHPHAGARDENGSWFYIPDLQAVRRTVIRRIQNDLESTNPNHYLPFSSTDENFNFSCQVPPGEGFEGPNGYKALREYVQLDGPDPLPEESTSIRESDFPTREGHFLRYPRNVMIRQQQQQQWNRSSSSSSSSSSHSSRNNPKSISPPPPRVLCSVYTHESKHNLVSDIADTWGWRCDGFFAASTRTDRSIGAVDLPHEGDETYNNMWQKTRSMVAFMYDNYLEEYDYFLLCGDDTFIIVENLRNYLLLLESQSGGRDAQPLYIGCPFRNHENQYNTGGPGYLLNRSAMRRLLEDGLPYFFAHHVSSGEDVIMGAIMTALHIHDVDTSDAANHQRFFHDDLNSVASDRPSQFFKFVTYKHGQRTGKDIISTQSVGFHRIGSMKRFHAILYNSCPKGTVIGDFQNTTKL